MKPVVRLLATGGVLGTIAGITVAVWYLFTKSAKTVESMQNAIDAPTGAQTEVKLRLTHYYPFAVATEAERKMEGGTKDRKGRPLHTVEDFLAGRSDYVSLAGDYTLWPDGQKILIPWGGKILAGRVVDTGGHFHGSKKVIRASGYEPIDVCVFDRNNRPPQSLVSGRVVSGEFFEKSAIQQPKFAAMGKPPSEVGHGFDLLGAEA